MMERDYLGDSLLKRPQSAEGLALLGDRLRAWPAGDRLRPKQNLVV